MANTASNFGFLAIWQECADIQERAKKAEANIYSDARVSCFYARNCVELFVEKVFDIDERLIRPRHDASLMTMIHDPGFKQNLKYSLFPKLKGIIQLGNQAVHATAPTQRDALQAVKELHHVLYWFARTYTPGLDRATFGPFVFDEALVPRTVAIDAQLAMSTANQIKELKQRVQEQDQAAREVEAKRLKESAELRLENEKLKQAVAQAVEAAASAEDPHDYNEEETRHWLIDPLLREAGWALDQEKDREYPVSGMPISPQNPAGNGKVDYVLWGDDGTALAVVEAKRTTLSPERGQTQAKLYADCLEKQCGVRPIIFYSNGYETRLWDDHNHPPRTVQGFYTKDELALMIKRRDERKHFFDPQQGNRDGVAALIDDKITNRHYQKAAITAILEHFEVENSRKALLVMATGTGKTRTIISLVDLLTQHNWVKNILFLADRNALLTQAKKNFVNLLPRISCTLLDSNLKKGSVDSRLYFSTYPTMKNLLDRPADTRPFGVGHFDLVVVDEAHRSVYAKYRQIFDYFDGYLVGLTATPKDEVDKNTYGIFDLQDGMPTYAYEDASAYAEGYLVPPTKISVATQFVRQGIKYDDLSDDEKAEWESKPELAELTEVLPTEVNNFLFNEHTAELMFSQLLSKDEYGGIHVEGGDVIGKTIIFAANNDHAEFLQKMFDKNYPKWKGKLCQVITYKNPYAQSLIDEFSVEGQGFDPKNPKLRIAISVDMLDTGIDVPEVVNLVFLKVIQSKVKFTQMIGRGTRLCENLFGPGDDKTTFKVFDYCQNFEFFNANPDGTVSGLAKPVSQQVFEKRVQLSISIAHLADKPPETDEERTAVEALKGLRSYTLDLLHHQVQGMNLDNFIVRPNRQHVERYLKREAWDAIDDARHTELETHISNLPTEAEPFNVDEQSNNLSNRFDNQILSMQLALLERGMVPEGLRIKVMEFAQQLEGKTTIPAVKQHLELIQDIQTIEFWQNIQLTTLEEIRRKLRNLMFALDREEKEVVYTDFTDSVLGVRDVTATYDIAPLDLTQYRKKTELYIKEHQDHLTIQKLKRNKPITQSDLDILEDLLVAASGVADKDTYREKVLDQKPLGTFIRELVGLDMNAAKEAFSDFLDEGVYNTKQIHFVNQIINFLMSNGILEVQQIFEPPFTDMHDESAYGLFDEDKVVELFGRIRKIRANANVGDIAS
ncbi:DEAD/DEAH box helicase family protein [Ketobacter sp. GenoA1]|uniref:DEAD/DEAH box helicase family protein n=1 Tax=Ketobacter sp. GenoA1 TaxID=2072747 RepID=UPI000F1E9C97|nr:DEAD/DEAH box helicase family protein [Ketobacter sp. GenoA1]RLT90789.1 MAG: DEAD/DEAH box helicase [Ketobacter sp. GenoA1]